MSPLIEITPGTPTITSALEADVSFGEAAPASTLAKGAIYFRKNSEGVIVSQYVGNAPSAPILVAEFNGIAANGSVTAEKLAEHAVLAAAIANAVIEARMIGNLGLGTIYAATGYGKVATATPGAKQQLWVPIKILQPCTLTGIRYQVGATSNGKAQSALYGPTGTSLKKSAAAEQSSAEKIQPLAFESTYAVPEPGVYWASLILESATGTFMGGNTLVPSKKEEQAEFKPKETALVWPTEPPVNTAMPLLAVY